MSSTLEEIHQLTPVRGQLPGESVPYYLESGEGERSEIGGQLVTVIARPQDSGGEFAAAFISGGRGIETPFFAHIAEHTTLVVYDGQLQVWLPGESAVLSPGDSVAIPAGTAYAYRMLSHFTKFLSWHTGGDSMGAVTKIGSPTTSHVPPATFSAMPSASQHSEILAEHGIVIADHEKVDPVRTHFAGLPEDQRAYFLSSGEGERLSTFNQLNTYLTRSRHNDNRYFSIQTTGAKAGYIPLHFHQHHTEMFFCQEGRVLIHANGSEILLTKGDFLHAPAGTIHAFALDSHYTKMLGFLTPPVFEKFFEYMNEPTEDFIFTESSEFYFPGAGFARAKAELDLVVVGPPPTRG